MKNIITLFVLSSLLFACQEEHVELPDVVNEPENETLEALTSHSWRFGEQFYRASEGQLVPYYTPNCVLDDSLVYRKDDLYLKYAGEVLCDPNHNQIDTLNWELMGDTALATWNYEIRTEKRIMLLTEDSLMLESVSPTNDTLAFLYLRY